MKTLRRERTFWISPCGPWNSLILAFLIAFAVTATVTTQAQTYSVLYSFGNGNGGNPAASQPGSKDDIGRKYQVEAREGYRIRAQ